MTLPKTLRHVQTQHGDDSVDVENIFLFSANLYAVSNTAGGGSTNDAELDAKLSAESVATVADNSEKPKSVDGVWTYEASEDCGSQVSYLVNFIS